MLFTVIYFLSSNTSTLSYMSDFVHEMFSNFSAKKALLEK
jgi:hypothetical protein